MFPAKVRLKVAASAECRGEEALNGVTQCVNGRRRDNDVYTDDGTARGNFETKGASREGVE